MKLFGTRNNERNDVHVDGDSGIVGGVAQTNFDGNRQSKEETADVPNTSEPAPIRRNSRKLWLKISVSALAIVALVLGVFAAIGRKELDPPSVVSSASMFGNSELRQTG
jgi:hypothetical protein